MCTTENHHDCAFTCWLASKRFPKADTSSRRTSSTTKPPRMSHPLRPRSSNRSSTRRRHTIALHRSASRSPFVRLSKQNCRARSQGHQDDERRRVLHITKRCIPILGVRNPDDRPQERSALLLFVSGNADLDNFCSTLFECRWARWIP